MDAHVSHGWEAEAGYSMLGATRGGGAHAAMVGLGPEHCRTAHVVGASTQ